jgi:hypothetical protein
VCQSLKYQRHPLPVDRQCRTCIGACASGQPAACHMRTSCGEMPRPVGQALGTVTPSGRSLSRGFSSRFGTGLFVYPWCIYSQEGKPANPIGLQYSRIINLWFINIKFYKPMVQKYAVLQSLSLQNASSINQGSVS